MSQDNIEIEIVIKTSPRARFSDRRRHVFPSAAQSMLSFLEARFKSL